jgi:Uma2 family endonuclease
MAVQLTKWRFTVDDYHRMVRAGILHEDDRVELIEGEVVKMTPIGPPHFGSVAQVAELFVQRFSDVALAVAQSPLQLDEHNEPEPDLLVLRRRRDFYRRSLPRPRDAFLVVEVADTSIEYDLTIKMPLYARHAIPEAWLADLNHGVLRVFRDPGPEGYRTEQIFERGEQVAPAAFPDPAIDVSDILG